MSTSTLSLHPADWRNLYRAALFEADRSKLAGRIADARSAVVLRARELFNTGDGNFEEEQDLDDALYALQALHNCLLMGTRSSLSA